MQERCATVPCLQRQTALGLLASAASLFAYAVMPMKDAGMVSLSP